MATRINKKFAILLSAVVVAIGGAAAWAVSTYFFKSAKEHAALAEAALEDGRSALAAGDYENANLYFSRSAGRYNSAVDNDSENVAWLYASMVPNGLYVCDNEAEANNKLSMIAAASRMAHHSIQATDADKTQYYDLLMSRHQMGLMVNGSLPWIPTIYNEADDEFQSNPGNALARRWRGIAGVYLLRNDMSAEDRAVSKDDLVATLEADPNDAVALHHLAIWHLNEARRLSRAGGEENSARVLDQYELATAYSTRALEVDPTGVTHRFDNVAVLASTPLSDENRDAIGDAMLSFANRLTEDPEARAALYPSQANQVIGWLGLYPGIVGDAESEAPAIAVRLGEALVADEPNNPAYHYALGQALVGAKRFAEAEAAFEAGLASSRIQHPVEYMLDRQTRLRLLAGLSGVYISLAAEAGSDTDARDRQLDKADETLARYRSAEGADARQHQANVDYLLGRSAFVRGVPHVAIRHLEQANLFFSNSNLQVVELLAKAYDTRGFTGEAAKHYELTLAIQPAARVARLRLVELYITRGGEYLAHADRHINAYLQYNAADVTALRLKARILATNKQYDAAIAVMEQIDFEEYPQLVGQYASYFSLAGDQERALELVRDRLAQEPNDRSALGVLFTLIPEQDARLAELDTLVANGLNEATDRLYRAMIENGGSLSPEQWEALVTEGVDNPELPILKQRFSRFAQTGDTAQMRAVLEELSALAPNDKDVLTWQYGLALEGNDLPLAESLIDQMLALRPVDRPEIAIDDAAFLRAQLRSLQAEAQAPEGERPDLRGVVRAYQRALENNPSHAPGWIELGVMYSRQEDWSRAREALNRAYQIQPENIRAASLFARALRQSEDVARALEVYRELASNQPNNRALVEEYLLYEAASGDREIAVNQREAIRERSPSDSANRRQLALLYADAERYADALAEIDAITQTQGASVATVNARSVILALMGEVSQGIDEYSAYITQLGADATSADYLGYATYLRRQDQMEAAEAAYLQAVAREDPTIRTASYAWAGVLAGIGRLDESVRLLQDLISAFPDNQQLVFDLVTVYKAMENYDLASQALSTLPDSAQKAHQHAQFELRRGQAEAALAITRDAVVTYPDVESLQTLLAGILDTLGAQDLQRGEADRGRQRMQEALTLYDRLVQNNPSSTGLLVLMARIENRLGQTEQATSRMIRLLDTQPNNSEARLTLYTIYMSQGQALQRADTRRAERGQAALSMIMPLIQQQADNVALLRGGAEAAAMAGQHAQAAGFYNDVFDKSGLIADLGGWVQALLAGNAVQQVVTLLENPEYASHLRDSIVLRAMQARAKAGVGQIEQARNAFTNMLANAESPTVVSAIVFQLQQSRLAGELTQIVDAALGDNRPPAIDLQLANHDTALKNWPAVIRRLEPYEADSTGNATLDYQIQLALALAYQESGGGQSQLLKAKAIYERLLQDPANADNINLLNNMAYLLTDQLEGQSYAEQAVGYAQRAIDLLTEQTPPIIRAQLLDTLGWSQFKAGDMQNAVRTLRTSIETYELSVNYKHLGLVYMAQNDDDRAYGALDDALDRTDNPEEQAAIREFMDQTNP